MKALMNPLARLVWSVLGLAFFATALFRHDWQTYTLLGFGCLIVTLLFEVKDEIAEVRKEQMRLAKTSYTVTWSPHQKTP